MGYKSVCLNCRKAFNTKRHYDAVGDCAECGQPMVFYNHKFRPPKRIDLKAWQVVRFLHDHGFHYDHVYHDLTLYNCYIPENEVSYPTTLQAAKEFVEKYKDQGKSIINT